MRRWTAKKNEKWSKHQQQRKRLKIWQSERLKNELENSNYTYFVTPSIYSVVKGRLKELDLTKTLPGRDALKEVLTFLWVTYKPSSDFHQYYMLALESARHKVKGRYFFKLEKKYVIDTLEDVEQVMKESLCTVGICKPVEEFIYSQMLK